MIVRRGNLPQHFCLAEDHRIEPRRDPAEVPDRIRAGVTVEAGAHLVGAEAPGPEQEIGEEIRNAVESESSEASPTTPSFPTTQTSMVSPSEVPDRYETMAVSGK